MDTMQTQLRVWTRRPSELLREVMQKPDPALIQVDDLVRQSRFNGLFLIFLRLSEAQNAALEGVATHLGLRYERCQIDHLYDNRWYPNNNPHDMGAHDAEIDMWHFKTIIYPRQYGLLDWKNPRMVEESSPQEALENSVRSIRQVLNDLSAIPVEQRRPEDVKLIAHNEGYLERIHQEFPHL